MAETGEYDVAGTYGARGSGWCQRHGANEWATCPDRLRWCLYSRIRWSATGGAWAAGLPASKDAPSPVQRAHGRVFRPRHLSLTGGITGTATVVGQVRESQYEGAA